ncbi:MAG TPA: sensor histidine kinase [Nitrososphaeraceae archaeon]|nr:sensor histidine kinase [Nitrososphaeraceae archaeon]
MTFSFLKSVSSVRFLIVVITMMLLFTSISTYSFFLNNSVRIDTIAVQNIKTNIDSQTKQLAEALTYRLEDISNQLYLLSNTPAIKGNKLTSITILEASQDATKALTSYYGWTDEKGNIKWATNFIDDKNYDNFLGSKVVFSKYFEQLKSTSGAYFTPFMPSLLNVYTMFISYPIFSTSTNNTLLNFSAAYTTKNLYEIVRNQQEKEEKSQKNFIGTTYAAINISKMGELMENQVSLKNRSSIVILDKDGKMIYSSNEKFYMTLQDSKRNETVIKGLYDPGNSIFLPQIKDLVLSGKSGNTDLMDKNGNMSTISFTPVRINGQNVFYLVLYIPHVFANEVNDLISQQQNFTMGSLFLTVAIVVIVVVMQGLFNNTLKKEVAKKTAELKNIILLLEKSNERLKQHDKMQKEFINIAAHELRTPTQSITGYIEMIDTFPENFNKYLEPLKRNAKRLSILIEDILDVTRIEAGTLKLDKTKFDLTEKINNVINDLTVGVEALRNHKINLILVRPKVPNMVFADKVRIYQVVNNLLTNAVKFTEGGTIITTIEKEYDKEANKEFAVVRIKDTGQGIHSDILPRLFQKFASKSTSGTGLGLYIAKSIVEAHAGRIWGMNNKDGKGAEFGFTLEIAKQS